MHEIDQHNAADYLRSTGHVPRDQPVEVRELSGGVSNIVLLVELPGHGGRFVVKQARGRLRVKDEWLCPVERIWREVDVLQTCEDLLRQSPQAGDELICEVPRVLWEDRDNYAYAMTAAPPEHKTWKERLLSGETSPALAAACGKLLSRLHAGSWDSAALAKRLGDRSFFDQLRLDPYYRHIARVHGDLAPAIGRLIDSVWENRCCLVHGDFSPKNLLVWPGRVMLIDFEVGHFGDPAFDLGFFVTHLVLKSIWSGSRRDKYLELATEFWHAYRATLEATINAAILAALESRGIWNLAGCMLARVDGKSPVDYLAEEQRSVVRTISRQWLNAPPETWAEVAGVLSTQY
jgi:5-methylthioribose kinase